MKKYPCQYCGGTHGSYSRTAICRWGGNSLHGWGRPINATMQYGHSGLHFGLMSALFKKREQPVEVPKTTQHRSLTST